MKPWMWNRLQPVAVINYPNDHDYTRVTEFKHLTGQAHAKTSVVYEYPLRWRRSLLSGAAAPRTPRSTSKYEALAAHTPGRAFCGRLATYKYYNMDQVVAQALTLCAKLPERLGANLFASRRVPVPGLRPA